MVTQHACPRTASWGGNVQIPVVALTVPLPLSPDFGVSHFPTLGWGVPSMHFVAATTFRGAHMGNQTFCHMLNVHCIKRQILRTLQCRRAQSHFVDGETEAQKGLVPGPSSRQDSNTSLSEPQATLLPAPGLCLDGCPHGGSLIWAPAQAASPRVSLLTPSFSQA